MDLISEIRFSLRILRKHAKLTCIAVASLAIGMAAASVGLSVFNAILLRPPAVTEPNRLLTIYTFAPDQRFNQVSYPDYLYFRDNNRVFSQLCAIPYSISKVAIVFEDRQKDSLTNSVSDSYFSTLGVRFLLGRGFSVGDDDKVATSVVLSYPYWKWLGSDRGIIGKILRINDVSLTIVGVTPQDFAGTIFSDVPDLWYPLSAETAIFHETSDSSWRADRTGRFYSLIGRLKPGVTRPQALADVQELSHQLAAANPEYDKSMTAALTQTTMFPPDSASGVKLVGALILAVIGLVLFAACANVANLLLALAGARRHEILLRAALGATRGRIIRQLLLDSTIISAAGGILGFALASYGLRRLLDFKPFIPGVGELALTLDFHPDLNVLATIIAVVVAVGFLTGLVPGLHASTPHLATALNGEIVIGGSRKGRARNLLVVAQVAACTVVSIGMGLCLKSLHNLQQVDLGYSARNVAVGFIDNIGSSGYSEQQGRALYERIRESVAQLPGIESISLAGVIPLSGSDGVDQVQIADAPDSAKSPVPIRYGIADGAYFSTLGIPVLTGRVFAASDVEKSPEVIVINRTMAEKYWPNQNAVGRTAHIENGNRQVTVIGVVGDSKYSDVDEAPQPFMYFALAQHYQPAITLLVRTRGNPSQWIGPLSETFRKLDPNLSFIGFTMDEWDKFGLYIPRLVLICVCVFGALAWLLAAVGLYGAVFYSVSERTREMGIRVVLGAEPWDLWKLILRQTGAVTAIGVCLGIGGGIGATLLVRSQLYGIRPVEWLVLFGVAVAMAAMAFVTAYAAARPWMRVDPMKSVRHV
jgi:predicted permease